jgi:ABC-type uncharacterized transport system auxiliary subunit
MPKMGPQAALYDFGVAANPTATALPNVRLGYVRPAPGLEGSDMRYRLTYKNPAQVFAYIESRWIAPPDRLLQRRMEQRLRTTGVAQCALNVTVDAFDQLFDTPTSSRGVVQLRATLTKGVGQKAIVQTTQVNVEHAAASADAPGGAAALDAASAEAVTGVLDWVSAQDCK